MSTSDDEYLVRIKRYAKRHYAKKFKKKYKGAWDTTKIAVAEECKRIETLIEKTDKAEVVHASNGHQLVKLYFRVAGTQQSAKGSGNRMIIYLNKKQMVCSWLLIYSKNEISPPNETQKWEKVIKNHYPGIWNHFE